MSSFGYFGLFWVLCLGILQVGSPIFFCGVAVSCGPFVDLFDARKHGHGG